MPKRLLMSAAPFVPGHASLRELANAVQDCRGCPLFAPATQAVFGEGAARARIMLVGEQPGDREDLEGHPFVGPAGRVLAEALAQADLARRDVYLTNAVKHFKHEPRGKRRLHRRPTLGEIRACKPWLDAEIARLRPTVIVAMGAVAVQSILGPAARLTKIMGSVQSLEGASLLATYHPSAVLRAPDAEGRARVRDQLVADLKRAQELAF